MTITLLNLIGLLPILITSVTIVAVMLSVAVRRHHWWNSTLTLVGLNVALFSIYFVFRAGAQSITPLLVVDSYACFYMALILVATLACATVSYAYLEGYPGHREEFYMLLMLAALGGLVMVCSRHMASFFIGLELLSIPVYGLVSYTLSRTRSLEGGIKYLVLSAAASACILFGMALLYAQLGTLSFVGLGAGFSSDSVRDPILLVGSAMIIIGIGFKLSLVPFHLWTPDVYQGAPAPVGAFLATASKVAVFAAFMRIYIESPALHDVLIEEILTVIAIISIVVGNLLALTQTNLKRLLGYSSIAHFGYLLVPLIVNNTVSIEAAGVYLVTYVITTLVAFGVVTLVSSPYQYEDADALFEYRGLFWKRPYLTAALTVVMLSLAGIPMTAGFIGKFYVIALGVDAQNWPLVAAVVFGSAVGIYYYLRVMVIMYLNEPGARRHEIANDWGQHIGGIMVMVMATLILLFGVYPQPLMKCINTITQISGIQ